MPQVADSPPPVVEPDGTRPPPPRDPAADRSPVRPAAGCEGTAEGTTEGRGSPRGSPPEIQAAPAGRPCRPYRGHLRARRRGDRHRVRGHGSRRTPPHPRPGQGQVDKLYQEAEAATEKYHGAEERGTGARTSLTRLAPGDLVFFYSGVSHVGLCIGGGQMIHAPRPGAPVRVAPIDRMPFTGATRPA
uniref:C40 family peptidase n=1 Tax=Streptomyces xantholiticus TaxID=68285 RepID=UPI00357121B1